MSDAMSVDVALPEKFPTPTESEESLISSDDESIPVEE
jgi:hypothetical protein